MIGNDIVDLQLAAHQSRWQRKGFLSKIFTSAEQSWIRDSGDPFTLVWLLWSCKEAVYKIVHRRTLVRSYAPQKFDCRELRIYEGQAAGSVVHEGARYVFKSLVCRDFVHTLAVTTAALRNKIFTVILPDGENSHADLLHDQEIVRDAEGVPSLLHRRTGMLRPVSISHHGRFFSMAGFMSSPSRSLHMPGL